MFGEEITLKKQGSEAARAEQKIEKENRSEEGAANE